jgi:iron complex outermembrane recepter protein
MAPARARLSRVFTAIVVVMCIAGVLRANPQDPDEHSTQPLDAPVLEQIIVTGSRIARRDFDSASPIVTAGPERFEQTVSPTVESTLNTLPQFVPSFTSTSNNPSNGGQGNLSLRGLGPQSTLALLDGRRLTPATGNGIVDLNIVPPPLVERVEVVSGGASAVYGSDAVAGVVNFKLRPSYEGLEIGSSMGRTHRADGGQHDVHVTAGTDFADGRGSVYGFASRSERRLVTHGDRAFSRHALIYVGPGNGSLGPHDAFVHGGSGVVEEGAAVLPVIGPNPISQAAFDTLFERYGYAPGTVPLQAVLGFNADGTLFTRGNFTADSVANFRGERDPVRFNSAFYAYNFAPENALQLPLERDTGFARVRFDASDGISVHADVLVADYTVAQRLAPAPVDRVLMPRDNPHISDDLARLLDSRPNPDADFQWFKRMSELGARVARTRYDLRQLTVGVDADVFDRWRLSAYLQHGESAHRNRQLGNALRSRIEELTFSADGGLAACGGLTPFGVGSISEDCARYVGVEGTNRTRLRQRVAELSVEGPIVALPAGDMRAAFGLFMKRDYYAYTADALVSRVLPDGRPDVVGFNASDNLRGRQRNTDAYIETLIPVLAERRGAVSLDVELGYRRAAYRTFGSVDAWKAALLYRPIESVALRGSLQNAVRAPGIVDLFQPQLPTVFPTSAGRDPCEADSPARTGPHAAAVEALCLAQGVPEALLPAFRDSDGIGLGFRGGNPDLVSEEARTHTIGVVWTPAISAMGLGRMQVSLDAYRIVLDGAIRRVSAGELMALCFDPVSNPTFSPDEVWCRTFAREPETGEVVDAYVINRNIAGIRTSGLDLQLDWRTTLGPGDLGANWLLSWLDSFARRAGPGAPAEELRGTLADVVAGASLPRMKWNLGVDYRWRDLRLHARLRHVDGMRDVVFPEFRVASRRYLDLFARYDFDGGAADGLMLAIGIENVLDRDPPIVASSTTANTDPQQYDVLGRRWFVRMGYRFY